MPIYRPSIAASSSDSGVGGKEIAFGGTLTTTAIEGHLLKPGDVSAAHQFFDAPQTAIATSHTVPVGTDAGVQASYHAQATFHASAAAEASLSQSAAAQIAPPSVDGALSTLSVQPIGFESAAVAPSMNAQVVASEAAAMGGHAVGHAAVGSAQAGALAIAGGEPVSPIIQLMMRMPGAAGVTHSFFEFLSHIFAPGAGDLIQAFDPTILNAQLGTHAGDLGRTALAGSEHMSFSLSLLPGNAHIFSTLSHSAHNLAPINQLSNLDLPQTQTMPTGAASPEHFRTDIHNVSDTPDLAHPQYEGTSTNSGYFPSQAQVASPEHAFGDAAGTARAGSGSMFANSGSMNVGGSAYGAPSQSALNSAQVNYGPSGAVGGMGTRNLLAQSLEPGGPKPTMGGYYTPEVSGSPSGTGAQYVEPLKAKQLSFEDMSQRNAAAGQHSAPQNLQTTSTEQSINQHLNSSKAPYEQAGSDAQNAPAQGEATAEYVVGKGDNLWDIAERKLGNANRWQEIYRLNTDVVGSNPDLILPGEHLRLPGFSEAHASAYVVQNGDNLWNIAKTHLGSGFRWNDLFKANANLINNPDLIFPGQQIEIPVPAQNIAAAPVDNTIAQTAAPAQSVAVQGFEVPANTVEAPLSAPQATGPAVGYSTPGSISMGEPIPQGNAAASYSAPVNYGPGAAGAATLNNGAGGATVSASLAPDLSFLQKKTQ